MENSTIALKQLFQQEFAKMVAVISKLFGLQHIEMAEDIVSETFLTASESWGMNGMPANPAAWLYTVAKQKTLYQFRRDKIYQSKVVPAISHEQTISTEPEPNFSPQYIRDSQLQMLFAICNPAIAGEAQIGLALRILCGFGIDEIAEAFLSNKETINKRLFRAKEKLREEKIKLEMPDDISLHARLDNVLHIIYLLFNEGYYSKTQNKILQEELCAEAIRLAILLTEYEATNLPKANALMALMCFHASRFAARTGEDEQMVLYEQQDETRWNSSLIRQGKIFLAYAADGDQLSSYHIEARIAYWHCIKEDSPQKWEEILQLYDLLLNINYSPSVALNRCYALYKVHGHETALQSTLDLQLTHSHFYWILLGELYAAGNKKEAATSFERALQLARSEREKEQIRKKIGAL